jgi:hypothetical protein
MHWPGKGASNVIPPLLHLCSLPAVLDVKPCQASTCRCAVQVSFDALACPPAPPPAPPPLEAGLLCKPWGCKHWLPAEVSEPCWSWFAGANSLEQATQRCVLEASAACRIPEKPSRAHAGLPKDNDVTRCDASGTSCYYLNTTAMSFLSAQKACKRIPGAHLVAWNTQAEQVGRQQGGCCLMCMWGLHAWHSLPQRCFSAARAAALHGQ